MKMIKKLVVIIHALLFILIGAALVSISFNLLSSIDVTDAINYAYTDPNVKLVVGAIGGVLILIGLLLASINLGKLQTQKTIAFENPEGQVTVSLSAIEDFIKKTVKNLPEVKEMRSVVTASRRGINIICRATILADSNIPETTERIQNLVKTKVHDMLGVEESINIKIHVTKISSKKTKGAEHQEPREPEEASRRMPFGAVE